MRERLAVYTDEISEDIEKACEIAANHGIRLIILRNIYDKNIIDCNDILCKKIKRSAEKHYLKIIALSSNITNIDNIEKLFILKEYYNSNYLRINIDVNDETFRNIHDRCLLSNCLALIDIKTDSKIDDLIALLSRYRRWRVWYDPALLIAKTNCNPMSKYYSRLKDYIGLIDVHDYKIGHGNKPAGYGDGKILELIEDNVNSNKVFCLEPCLGNKYNGITSREETFKLALSAFESLIDNFQN